MTLLKSYNYTYTATAESTSNPAADVDTIADAQSVATPFYMSLSGGAATAGDGDGICQSQSRSGAGAMNINGADSSENPVTRLSYVKYTVPRTIAFYSGSDNSAITLTVKGLGVNGVVQSEEITGPNNSYTVSSNMWTQVTNVYASDTIASLLLGDPYGYVDHGSLMRQCSITSSGNDSGITFTVQGTDHQNKAQTETITGPSSTTVNGSSYFRVVSSVSTSNTGTGSISIGWVAGIRVMINSQLSQLMNWYTVEGDNAAEAQLSIENGATSSASGTERLKFNPGNTAGTVNYPNIGGEGIRFAGSMSFDMPADADLLKEITFMYSG